MITGWPDSSVLQPGSGGAHLYPWHSGGRGRRIWVLRPAWSTKWVPRQPVLLQRRNPVLKQTNKQTTKQNKTKNNSSMLQSFVRISKCSIFYLWQRFKLVVQIIATLCLLKKKPELPAYAFPKPATSKNTEQAAWWLGGLFPPSSCLYHVWELGQRRCQPPSFRLQLCRNETWTQDYLKTQKNTNKQTNTPEIIWDAFSERVQWKMGRGWRDGSAIKDTCWFYSTWVWVPTPHMAANNHL